MAMHDAADRYVDRPRISHSSRQKGSSHDYLIIFTYMDTTNKRVCIIDVHLAGVDTEQCSVIKPTYLASHFFLGIILIIIPASLHHHHRVREHRRDVHHT